MAAPAWVACTKVKRQRSKVRSRSGRSSERPFLCTSVESFRQRERHGDRHHDGYRLSIQQRRRELPVGDGLKRRTIEQLDRAQHLHFAHVAGLVDYRLQDHRAFFPRGERNLWIGRCDVNDAGRWPDVSTDGNRIVGCLRHGRGREVVTCRSIADRYADDSTGITGIDLRRRNGDQWWVVNRQFLRFIDGERLNRLGGWRRW